jgi:hypothetical protein
MPAARGEASDALRGWGRRTFSPFSRAAARRSRTMRVGADAYRSSAQKYAGSQRVRVERRGGCARSGSRAGPSPAAPPPAPCLRAPGRQSSARSRASGRRRRREARERDAAARAARWLRATPPRARRPRARRPAAAARGLFLCARRAPSTHLDAASPACALTNPEEACARRDGPPQRRRGPGLDLRRPLRARAAEVAMRPRGAGCRGPEARAPAGGRAIRRRRRAAAARLAGRPMLIGTPPYADAGPL